MLKASPQIEANREQGAKTSKSEKDKKTKATIGKKKCWKAKFAELEAKMATISTTTTPGSSKHGCQAHDSRWTDRWMDGQTIAT